MRIYKQCNLPIAIGIAVLTLTGGGYAHLALADTSAPGGTSAVDPQQPQTSAPGATTDAPRKKPQTLQAIEVTGTHIRAAELATQEPIVTITHEQMVRSGLITVGQVLNSMTTAGVSGLNTQSVQSPDSINQGGSFVNLRYLGSQRVLVLVNGKRWVTNPDGSTDLSTIPTSVISRIEILKDGASAIYGSDAISGVINIITRKSFNGAQLNVGYGQTDIGDNQQPHADVMLGTVNDKSSLLMDVSFTSIGAMWDRSRAITASGEGGPYHPTSAFYQSSPRGRFNLPNGESFILNKLGDDTANIANYTQVDPNNLPLSDTYNQFNQGQFRIPSKQASLYVTGKHVINDHLTMTGTAMYTERRNVSSIGPFPLSAGIFQGLGGMISADSLYNPVHQDVTFNVIYPNLPRVTTHLVRSMHFDGGLNGYFDMFGLGDWHWDAYLNYNKQSGRSTLHNQINLLFLQRGIGPSFINAEGQPTCGTPDDPLDTNQIQEPCIPINVLGGYTALTPQITDQLVINPVYTFQFTDKEAGADITGPLFRIPFGGSVQFAAGVADRKETGFSRMELFKQLGLTTSATGTDTNGEFTVKSAYLEVNIPLVRNLPGVQDLDFDIATRYSKYSNFGSTNNAKLGIQYRPIHDLLLRGTYAEAFRAPTIDDFAGGEVNGFGNYTDPCDAVFGQSVYGAAAHNSCVSQLRSLGIANPDAFRQVSHDGSPITFPGEEVGELSTTGPSPGLGPETAKTTTFGFLYSPKQVPGLDVAVNWWVVRLRNVITPVTGNDVLQGCYSGLIPSDCGSFSRDSITGQIVDMFTGLVNEGREKVEGQDLTINYRLPETPFGQFAVHSEISYYSHMEVEHAQGEQIEQLIGWNSGTFGPIWRVRSNSSLTWNRGPWSAMWRVRYFSSLKEPCAFGTSTECNMPDHIDPFRGALPTNRVGSTTYNDVSGTWNGGAVGEFTLGVNNVFDRDPPITYTGASGDAPILPAYDVGRFWYFNYKLRF